MRTVTYYISDDGEEFDSMEACQAWEEKINKVPPSIHFLNENGIEYICKNLVDIENAYNECEFIRIDDTPTWEEDVKFAYDQWGYCIDHLTPGVYAYKYIDCMYDWVKVENV